MRRTPPPALKMIEVRIFRFGVAAPTVDWISAFVEWVSDYSFRVWIPTTAEKREYPIDSPDWRIPGAFTGTLEI